jgi:D-glycero-D-manno-heptose 1,7-bisphosphate phosphatase
MYKLYYTTMDNGRWLREWSQDLDSLIALAESEQHRYDGADIEDDEGRAVWEPSLGMEAGQDSPRLYIFDKDGTLVTKRGGGDPPIPNHVDEQIPLPGVLEKCRELREAGHTLAIASNQGGVAFGFIEPKQAVSLMEHALRLIGAKSYLHCIHHPKGTVDEYATECSFRKPAPGMITLLMQRLDFKAKDTIFIGDMDTDRQAAEAAGVRFVWADEFFYSDCKEPFRNGPDTDF